jgi:hypothetical protein
VLLLAYHNLLSMHRNIAVALLPLLLPLLLLLLLLPSGPGVPDREECQP